MPDEIEAKKPVSDRRKQQNARAQKKYRARQKQQIENLQALLAIQEQPAEDATGSLLGQVPEGDPSYPCLQNAESNINSINTCSSSSNIQDPCLASSPIDPWPVLNLVSQNGASVDESVRARIFTGEITMGDIIKAGLDSIKRQFTDMDRVESRSEEQLPTALRTDRILVPQNKNLVYPHSIPDIYSNNLRVKQFSLVAAIRANAELLGLTFEEITSPETESPFYTGATDEENNGLGRSMSFQALKSHLRPTQSQLKYSHHPYIDILPCPTFRERFINLISMDPPMVDEDEFCEDVQKDGLICWGTHSGLEHEASGSGAPWDLRSWEAQPWFLKKWWFVLGGEEGELSQQTRWWHEARGDQMPSIW